MDKTETPSGLDFSPELNMARYLQKISKYPILTPEEEFQLAKSYVASKDSKLACKLITSHLRFVVKVVSRYKGYGLPINEMIAEGNMGLLYAVNKFDPDKGFRFSTYALWWIKASVQKYILNSWSLVKIGTTTAQKRLFFNLRKIKNRLNLIEEKSLSMEMLSQIACSLEVSVQEVVDMNNRLISQDSSLNTSFNNSEDTRTEWQDFIIDKKPNQEEYMAYSENYAYRRKILHQALKCLDDRERDILYCRHLCDKSTTLEDLSQKYKISKERVRQIEVKSIKKLQKEIKRIVA